MIWKTYFSKTVLLSSYALFLYALHTVANLSTCVELWANEKPYGYMLLRFPLGFLAIFFILFLFTLAGIGLAKTRALEKEYCDRC